MIVLLRDNPLLLLFFVTALGYGLGRVNIFGVRLGVAAVLFAGIALGALDPGLQLPSLTFQLGLVIFVYMIGLENGVSFFASFQNKRGVRQLRFVLFFLLLPAVLAAGAFWLVGVSPTEAAGMFSGLSTNTAALAAVLDTLSAGQNSASADALLAEAVLGYSVAYPVGVVGRMGMIALMQRVWRIDFAAEAHALRNVYPIDRDIVSPCVLVTNLEVTGVFVRDLRRKHGWNVVFGRIKRNDNISLVNSDTQFQLDDKIIIAGTEEDVQPVVDLIGEPTQDDLLTDMTVYTRRRLFVSNNAVVGQSITALGLREKYGAIVSRVRRGDIDVIADGDTVLELGDRVRVVARRQDMPEITELFGDSYNAVSQVNLLSFGLGITIGLLLGTVEFGIGGSTYRLGFAGGPLIVALILGALRRTGPIVWTMPYAANQSLRQIGLILLLAGVGVRSGNSLVNAFSGTAGITIAIASVVIMLLTMLIGLFVGYKLFKIPFSILIGMVASQPAVLTYASDRTKNQLPNIGFSFAVPIGIIVKVALAQILLSVLQNF